MKFYLFLSLFSFSVIADVTKPDLKIALIGGSAARGYDGLRGVAEILNTDFRHYYPDRNIIVTPFWGLANPDPFVRGQALILRQELKNHDLFLIYTGNTEVKNYLHDSQLFIKKEFRHLYPIRRSHYPEIIESTQQNYWEKLFDRAKDKLVHWGILEQKREISHQNFPRFERFAKDRIPPEIIFNQALVDFNRELDSLVKVGKELNKDFILSTLPSNLSWRPWFSFGLVNSQKLDLEHNPLVAEFWYERGIDQLRQKKFRKAFDDLKKARDLDGFFARAVSKQHQDLKQLPQIHKNSIFIDPEAHFLNLIENGKLTFSELFSSMQHMSFLGNVLVSRDFFCTIVDHYQKIFRHPCVLSHEKDSEKSLESIYLLRMKVTEEEIKHNHFMIARWHLAMSDLASLPSDFYDLSENHLEVYKSLIKTDEEQIKYHLYSALLWLKRGDRARGLFFSNKAHGVKKNSVLSELNQYLPNGLLLIQSFEQNGLFYLKSENKFDLK